MNDAQQTPARGSNIVSHDRGYSCRGRLLRSSRAEHPTCLPCPVLGCFHGLPLVSGFERYKGTTDANAGERCSGWRHLLCCGYTVRGLVSYVVFKRTNRKLGATDGEAAAQPSQNSISFNEFQ
jgi:hypothetical protein